jgi:predicted nuclease with TOPRIM domain
MAKNTGTPLMKNKHIKELLEIMKANRMSGTKDLHTIIGYVSAVERKLAGMENEMKAMRQELETMRDQPQRKALQSVITALQEKISKLREQLNELKQNIIDGCKNAVAAFKEKGLSALRNITDFLHIRPGLESIRNNLDRGIRQDDAAIAKIEAVSAEYHKAGRHIKNMGRAMAGKEATQEVKPSGKLAKALEAPYRADRACLAAMRKSVNAAIGVVARLDKAERKPPVIDTLKKFDEQIKQTQKDAPAKMRLKPVNREGR